jgi:hypothetical protein
MAAAELRINKQGNRAKRLLVFVRSNQHVSFVGRRSISGKDGCPSIALRAAAPASIPCTAPSFGRYDLCRGQARMCSSQRLARQRPRLGSCECCSELGEPRSCRSRCIRICSGIRPDLSSPTMVMIRDRWRTTSVTEACNRPLGILSWPKAGSRNSGATRQRLPSFLSRH